MVWTICLLFFQLSLLAGYSYTHGIRTFFNPRQQVTVHLILVICALLMLPITPAPAAGPYPLDSPLVSIMILLATTVGIPYLLISASGPLLQHWFKTVHPQTSPYRLYALSNVGSLIGLLSYPFLIEPLLALQMQTWLWSAGFFLYALMCASCTWSIYLNKEDSQFNRTNPCTSSMPVDLSDRVLWILLPFNASMLLLASTNQISQDIASVPLIWLLPLSLYLLSFIICFDKARWYDRRLWIPLLIISSVMAIYARERESLSTILFQISVYSSLLFCACMVCHGELVRIKPHPDRLTGFYLFISLGGALGSIFVALIAPLIFTGYWELQISWIVVFILLGACLFKGNTSGGYWAQNIKRTVWALLSGAITIVLLIQIDNWNSDAIYVERNFYGVLRVKEYKEESESVTLQRLLLSGGILHGSQNISNTKTQLVPTSYYGTESGIGIAINEHPKHANEGAEEKFHIGVVGLGVGTIAALADNNDEIRFYEINPKVIEVSQSFFTFLTDTKARWKSVLGDARISMQEEIQGGQVQAFDVLAVDAFSGDSVPVHLLTLESFELYWKHLKDDGVLAVHISNRHLDLTEVVRLAGEKLDKQVIKISSEENEETLTKPATWILLSNNEEFLQSARVKERSSQDIQTGRNISMWTDDYSNLFELIK